MHKRSMTKSSSKTNKSSTIYTSTSKTNQPNPLSTSRKRQTTEDHNKKFRHLRIIKKVHTELQGAVQTIYTPSPKEFTKGGEKRECENCDDDDIRVLKAKKLLNMVNDSAVDLIAPGIAQIGHLEVYLNSAVVVTEIYKVEKEFKLFAVKYELVLEQIIEKQNLDYRKKIGFGFSLVLEQLKRLTKKDDRNADTKFKRSADFQCLLFSKFKPKDKKRSPLRRIVRYGIMDEIMDIEQKKVKKPVKIIAIRRDKETKYATFTKHRLELNEPYVNPTVWKIKTEELDDEKEFKKGTLKFEKCKVWSVLRSRTLLWTCRIHKLRLERIKIQDKLVSVMFAIDDEINNNSSTFSLEKIKKLRRKKLVFDQMHTFTYLARYSSLNAEKKVERKEREKERRERKDTTMGL